jgi:dTDP-4-amino-4,6-dideoxygalactose transaminase
MILKIYLTTKLLIKNQLSGYPEIVEKFENDFKSYIGKKYSLTFHNGSSAIRASINSLGMEDHSEILIPSYCFHSPADQVSISGYKNIFIKNNIETLTVSVNDLEKKISKKTKAVIIVHPFGFSCEINEIVELCKKYNLYLIEDCSHSHGGSYDNKKLGSYGDVSIFSLQNNKAISAGEGGIALTNSKKLYLKMSFYGHYSRHKKELENTNFAKYSFTGWGEKLRAHPLGIAIAYVDLKFINRINKNKNKIYEILLKKICNPKLSIIKKVEKSIPGGFFSGIPIIFKNKKDLKKAKELFKKHKINMNDDPWPDLNNMEVYNRDIRENLMKKELIYKDEIKDLKLFNSNNILLIPWKKFLNSNYSKIVKIINEI